MTDDAATKQALTEKVLWEAESVASAWRKWGRVFAQRKDTDVYLKLAGVEAGHEVLEVGAGTGDQTIALAERVGSGGRVLATDLSPAMLEITEDRIGEAGYDNVEYMVGNGATLELPQGAFDAAVSGFTLMLTADPTAVATTVHGALKPGARYVASVWGPPPTAPMFTLAMMTAVSVLGVSPPAPDGPGLFSLADPARFEGVLREAGFEEVTTDMYPFPFRFASADEYAAMFRDVAPPLQSLIDEHAPDRSDEVWERIAEAADQQAGPDGAVTFDNQMLVAVGTRSG